MANKGLSKRKYLVARRNISGLIRLAINDLKACIEDPNYRIYMSDWHVPNGSCAVCFAGSVMAKTMHTSSNLHVSPYDFEPLVQDQLFALNALRAGCPEEAWDHLFDAVENPPKYPLRREYYEVPSFERQRPAKFINAMERMAQRFEKAGY